PQQWYAQRHLAHPELYTMYTTAPVGVCQTYYYFFQPQNAYYCYTGGETVTAPGGVTGDDVAPGVAAVPGVGVVSRAGVALQRDRTTIPQQYQYYNAPFDDYGYDWYAQRHLAYPQLYTAYPTEPVGVCQTYYYFYQPQNVFYCYTGGGAMTGPGVVPGVGVAPGVAAVPGVGVVSPAGLPLQSYWAHIPQHYQHYNTPFDH